MKNRAQTPIFSTARREQPALRLGFPSPPLCMNYGWEPIISTAPNASTTSRVSVWKATSGKFSAPDVWGSVVCVAVLPRDNVSIRVDPRFVFTFTSHEVFHRGVFEPTRRLKVFDLTSCSKKMLESLLRSISVTCAGLLIFLTVFQQIAHAVPSYARQTGLSCNGCHYTPPELNAAGRQFKLYGYIDRDRTKIGSVTAKQDGRHAGLDLLAALPLSAWLETSFTNIKTPQPGTQNGNVEFPQDISLFLAGAWSTHIGSFLQLTYDTQSDHLGMDNTDIRYARVKQLAGKEWVLGLTLNNNPTVEDLWNDTPAWGFPFMESDVAPGPTAGPIIQGALGQDVAGVGAYTMWDQHLYLAGTIYRSAHIGTSQPTTGEGFDFNIRGVAPYWRIAWQQNGLKNNLEVGTYGMHMTSTPGGITGLEDTYTDAAVDFQYDRTIGKDVFSWRGSYIRENSNLVASLAADAAGLSTHHLNTFNTNAEYHFGNRYSAALGWFTTTGTTDPVLYAQSEVEGSANGSPQSAGYTVNFSVWPVQNLDLGLQYTGYTRFNGAAINYDGAGRKATGNNAVYLLARFVF
jgi:hypothetical protein